MNENGGDLEERVRSLPDRPGVYLFSDARGRIIYVGKASSLRNRVRTYFQSPRGLAPWTARMVRQIAALDYITTDSEVEALILENNLIKAHHPHYNIRLRDDKQYPYLKVTLDEEFPRVLVVRAAGRDGARYFGPYTRSSAVHETLRTIRKLFPFRTCGNARFGRGGRPCLNYHIRRCLGPCQGSVTADEYRAMIRDLCLFLEGRSDEVLAHLRARMEEAADGLRFEEAARLRDQIAAVEKVTEKQKMFFPSLADQDALGLARGGDEAFVHVFTIREGRLTGREGAIMAAWEDAPDGEVLSGFLKQFYGGASFVPREILLPVEVEDRDLLERWLSGLRGGRVRLRRPARGERRKLVELATENARLAMADHRAAREREEAMTGGANAELADALGLAAPPRRIECYDISNIQGRQAVGSMVVFIDGRPARGEYRRFQIKTVEGPDDYAMMKEVIGRRFRRGFAEREAALSDRTLDRCSLKFEDFPDLVIVDGGVGQLNAALEVMSPLGLAIPAFGLAKEREELYAPGRPEPIVLPRQSAALHLLQRLRDEAHRFAVGYHRKVRNAEGLRSILDDVPGIGPRRKAVLLKAYPTLAAIREASVEELRGLPGMNAAAAEAVKEYLGRTRSQ